MKSKWTNFWQNFYFQFFPLMVVFWPQGKNFQLFILPMSFAEMDKQCCLFGIEINYRDYMRRTKSIVAISFLKWIWQIGKRSYNEK